MCSSESAIILLVLLLLIGTIICFQDKPLVTMLILVLCFSDILKIDLLICLIFLWESSGKFSLILRIVSMFFDKIWAEDSFEVSTIFPILLGMFFPWNFNFAKTSFDGLGESWDRCSFEKFTSSKGRELLVFLPLLGIGTSIVNLFFMSLQNVLLLSILSWSHPPLNIEDTNLKVTWPKPLRKEMLSSLLLFSSLLLMKLEIHEREILMLLTLISCKVIWLNIEIRFVWTSHKLGLPS